MTSGIQTFRTQLSGQAGSPTGIEVPPGVMAALTSQKKAPVWVTVNGYRYRSSVAVTGGKFMIPVSAAHRTAAGLTAGDALEVSLELDTQPRTVDVPADLSEALEQRNLRAAFDALAPSRQKEQVRQLEEARTPETRQRRLQAVLQKLEPEARSG